MERPSAGRPRRSCRPRVQTHLILSAKCLWRSSSPRRVLLRRCPTIRRFLRVLECSILQCGQRRATPRVAGRMRAASTKESVLEAHTGPKLETMAIWPARMHLTTSVTWCGLCNCTRLVLAIGGAGRKIPTMSNALMWSRNCETSTTAFGD